MKAPPEHVPDGRKRPAPWMRQVATSFMAAYGDGDWRGIRYRSVSILLHAGREVGEQGRRLPVRVLLELRDKKYVVRIRRERPSGEFFGQVLYVLFVLPVDLPVETRFWKGTPDNMSRLIMTPIAECHAGDPDELAEQVGNEIWRDWWRGHGGDDDGLDPPWPAPPVLDGSTKDRVLVS